MSGFCDCRLGKSQANPRCPREGQNNDVLKERVMHEAEQGEKKQNAQPGCAKVLLTPKVFGQRKERHECEQQTQEATFSRNSQRLVVGFSWVLFHGGGHVLRRECSWTKLACADANQG